MKIPHSLPIAVALCAALFLGCSSVEHYQKIDNALDGDDFGDAIEIAQAEKGNAYQEKDFCLYHLDVGMLEHFGNRAQDSSASLSEAERLIEEAYTKSVSLEVSSYLVNDTVKEYAGEDYEDIYLNVFKAIDYAKLGQNEDAMVEIRRVGNKLKELSRKYDQALSQAQADADEQSESEDEEADDSYEGSSEDSEDSGVTIEASSVKFSDSALARYLSMIFYRAAGNLDDAQIDLRYLRDAMRTQPSLYRFSEPSTLSAETRVPKGKARLNVIGFAGLSPIKEQREIRVPIRRGNYVKIALPEMVARISQVSRAEIVMDNGSVIALDPLEDLSAVAMETFKTHQAVIYFKSIARAIAKTATSEVLEDQSGRAKDGETAQLLFVLSQVSKVYNEASEQADLRSARYFPGTARVAGITLDPGVYSFTVRFLDQNGAVVDLKRFINVKVDKNQVNLVEAVCLR
jgi:hypothetical protein